MDRGHSPSADLVSAVSKPIEPVKVPETYKARPLDKQIEDVNEMLHNLDEDERRRRLHPNFAAFHRHKLKSVLKTLQGVQAQQQVQS